MRVAIASATLGLWATVAIGASSPEGFYQRTGAYPSSALIIATEGASPFAGRFTTGRPGDPAHCGGEFAATGKPDGTNRLIFTGDADQGKICQITATFNKAYSDILIEEDGCTNYHGASCDFSGTVSRTR